MMMIINHKQKTNDNNRGVIVVQNPSTKRIISVKTHKDYKHNKYFLSVPPTAFRIYYKYYPEYKKYKTIGFAGFFHDEEKIYLMPFYNTNTFGWVCLGENELHSTLEELTKKTVNQFWTNIFNDDISSAYDEYRRNVKSMAKPNADNLLSNYGLWQIKTKEDPNWIPDKSLLIELERGHKSSFKEFIDVDNEEWNEGYSE